MCKNAFVIFLLLFHFFSYPQFLVNVENNKGNKAALFGLEGEKVSFIDSLNSNENSEFHFNLAGNYLGIYRLSFINNKYINFIYDNEETEIEIDLENLLESVNVLKSESNKIYYDFIMLNKDYKTKTELLQLMLARYPQEDDYYQTTMQKLIQIQEDYLNFVNTTSQKNPESFVARYVISAQLPFVPPEIPFDEQLAYLKAHALDNVNFYDDGLIYSDAFTIKTIEYLTYYRNPQLPLELLEKEFITAVDSILNKAKVNNIIYQHIVEYLIDGFKTYGFDNVIDYIVENYVIKDDLCLDTKLRDSIERRIEQARNFKIGNTVPDIHTSDSAGTKFSLDDIQSERVLLLFYASWCTHCQNLIPKIYELYKSQQEKNTEVVAVSIDTSRTDLLNFISANELDWFNIADLKGWNGEAAKDYFIYATPTMFLIDKDRKLIAKPTSIDDLRHWFDPSN